ncbi:triose-phosphate isomerase [Candidatus Puniceispirillum sp.]|mgnify:CR=1 FL=1|uniref:triose-phosphate isomerase n=1 Tax=Candidatus Puniceispirillum sp. TaxID=2026719 RepID=UPI001EC5D647|nr:triose-phosphate isomerase [Candidatus Puniceispirillum sp.]MBT6567201.1 triose-phosphate isomerase [Candidatus Puniceispirillum sp.]
MIIAANWKMNPDLETAGTLASRLASIAFEGVRRVLFAPHPYIIPMSIRLAQSDIVLGGQDCHATESGAHTGDVSALMLRDSGAKMVLLGHSERRSDHGEDDTLVMAKVNAGLANGLEVMICVGETRIDREAGNAENVVLEQLEGSIPKDMDPTRLIVAYEPVWAIGTGLVPSSEDIVAMHTKIASWLATSFPNSGIDHIPVLYGGSVKPDNAAEILSLDAVDGALVGGASLNADGFEAICEAASQVA